MLFRNTWTRQPQQPVPIDWGNPISRGLVRFANAALATPSGVLVDSADPSVTYTSATPALATNAAGRSLAKASTALWVGSSAKAQDAIGTGDFTMFGGGVNTGTGSSEYLCMIGDSGTSAVGFTFVGHRSGSVIAVNTFGGTLAVAPIAAHIAGRFECIVAARRGGTIFFFQNGQYLGSAAHASSVASKAFSLNSNSGGTHDVNFAGLFTRGLSDAECRSLSENPWQLFQPTSRKIWVPGVSGVSGTLAQTNSNDTSAASGSTTIVGTLAKTNANDTASASGSTSVTGALAKTNANDSLAASGSVGGGTVTGTVAYTNANDSAAAAGSTSVTGTLAKTNANDSVSASGNAGAISGTVNVTNANDTAESTSPTSGGGSYDEPRPKRRRHIIEVDGRLLEFGSKAAAIRYLDNIKPDIADKPDDTPDDIQPVISNKPKKPLPAPKLDIPLAQIEVSAPNNKALEQFKAQLRALEYQAILKAYEDWQDEQDIEILLMAM